MFEVDRHSTKTHVCDMSCPWIVHGTVHYCAWSGLVHVCSSVSCEFTAPSEREPSEDDDVMRLGRTHTLRANAEMRSCRITGQMYDLPFGYTFEQTGHMDPTRRRAVSTRTVFNPDAAAKRVRRHGAGGDYLCTMTPSPSPSPPPALRAPHQLLTTQSQEEELLITAGYINQFLVHPLTLEQCRVLSAEIITVGRWMKKAAARAGETIPAGYTPMAHVLTLLLCMSQAAEIAHGMVFVRFHAELAGRLKSFADCIRITGARNQSKQHTEWYTMLCTLKLVYCRHKALDPPSPTPLGPLASPITPMPMKQLRAPRQEDRGRLMTDLPDGFSLFQSQWPLLPPAAAQ